MGVPYKEAQSGFDEAVKKLFRSDSRVHAVGITSHQGAFGYRAVRNIHRIVAESSGKAAPPTAIKGVPVVYADAPSDPQSVMKIPSSGPVSPEDTTLILERQVQRPIVSGIQIQNFDDDIRTGVIAGGHIIIGTLGCFVRLTGDTQNLYILSNNHVVAAENRGKKGKDRILQPGSGVFTDAAHIATLFNFVRIRFSAVGATVVNGKAKLNDVDAGIARLKAGLNHANGYLPFRHLPAPNGTAKAQVGDRVFKVGRTTGLTKGTITSVTTVVGPVDYDNKPAWFRNSIEIEGLNGTLFSNRGDSGSAIVRENTGEVVGLLYAGNGQQTYACPIDLVLKKLKCAIA